MRIITKLDRQFLIVYSVIIGVVGLGACVASGYIPLLPITIAAEGVYLYFALRRSIGRYKALKEPFPSAWRQILLEYSPIYRFLDEPAKQRFQHDIQIFLKDFTVQGMRRGEIDVQTKLLVAASFAYMLHGQPQWEPPIKDGVLVYPGYNFNRDYEIGTGNFGGMATANSPLIITEGSLVESFATPGSGANVVIHELAHYFDMEDGQAEGVPAARLEPEKLEEWQQAVTKEWQRAAQGKSFLREYAATNEAELFACAAEVFFESPERMITHNLELYELFKDFFNLDPYAMMATHN